MTDLGTPLDLPCGQRLPNRLMKSALSEALGTSDGAPTRRLERLYDAWAGGGWGLVVTGNVMVDLRHRGEPGNVVVEDERHLDALRRWAAGFRASGTPLWMQVNHPGRQANVLVGRTRPVAPSAVAADVAVATRPRALTEAEIRETIERYAATAAVAETAGFDGVQVHGAHGYLVTQFLSPRSNQRTDAWGGDPERRRRFVIEVVRAIRERVSPGFAVGIKLNSADFQRGGFTESESREVVAALAEEGIDLLEVSGGTYESPVMFGPDTRRASTREREAYFLEYAASVRDAAGAVPVAVTGGFRTRAAMTAALGPDESDTGTSSTAAPGECDVVGLGRPASAYPHVARDLLEGRRERIELPAVRVGARHLVRRLAPLHTVDSALDLSWHTDQLHRLGAGKAPDLARPWWRTAVTATLRNGPGAFVPKRGWVPEGDSVHLLARRLDRSLRGRTVARSDLRVPRLATKDLAGREVLEHATHGKHLLTRFSGGVTLHSHLRMDGSWTVTGAGKRLPRRLLPDVRVVLETTEGPTAWGQKLHDLALVATADESALVGHLGPDPLREDWDPAEAVRRLLAHPTTPLVSALLDQTNLAGLGNLWVNELAFLVGRSPWTPVGEVDVPALVDRAATALRHSATVPGAYQVTTGIARRGESHWVAGRARRPCLRCGTTVQVVAELPNDAAHRRTWWCPHCQPGPGPEVRVASVLR